MLYAILMLIISGHLYLFGQEKLERLEQLVEDQPSAALTLSEELLRGEQSSLSRARILNARSLALYMVNNFDKAMVTAKQAEKVALDGGHTEQLAHALYHQSSILWRKGLYPQAYELATRSLQKFEGTNNLIGRIMSANRTSTILAELNNFDKARDFSELTLQLAREAKDQKLLGRMLSNRAYVHYRQKDFQNMLRFSLQAIDTYREIHEEGFMRHAMINAGVAHLELGQLVQARVYLEQSIPISQNQQDRLTELIAWKFLARAYRLEQNTPAALIDAGKALAIAKAIQSPFEIKNVTLELAEIHSLNGDFKAAFHHLNEAYGMQEDLQGKELSDKISATLSQYEIEKRENEIKILQQEKTIGDLSLNQQRSIKNFLLLTALILTLATAFSLRALLAKRRANRLISSQNIELQAIDNIVRDINKEVDLKRLMNAIFRHTLALVPQTEKGGFLYYFQESDSFRPVIHFGYDETLETDLSFTPQEAAKRYKEGAQTVAPGIFLLRSPHDSYGSEKIGRLVALPKAILALELAMEGRTVGYLLFENMHDSEAFKTSDVGRLTRIREHLVSAIAKVDYIARLEEAARTDPLTSLWNRRGMIEKLNGEITRFVRYQTPFSIAIGDLDDFKRINDSFGHECGDQALLNISKIFKTRLRNTDQTGRWGGEEFLILLPQTAEIQAQTALDNVRRQISDKGFLYQDKVINLSMTFGLTEFKKGISLDECLSQADSALYHGKTLGKNQIVPFSALS